MALPREMRFRDRKAVRRVMSRGYRLQSLLGPVSITAKEKTFGRILFVVSNRVSKKSTQRHAIQRRLNEWARLHRADFSDWDIVISVLPTLRDLDLQELTKRVASLGPLIRARVKR